MIVVNFIDVNIQKLYFYIIKVGTYLLWTNTVNFNIILQCTKIKQKVDKNES